MRKILGEYSQIIGYTFTGLVFGLAFFLLFLNFYHYKEVNLKVEKTEDTELVTSRINNNLSQVRTNAMSYDINNYHGSESGYELMAVQSKLTLCVDALEDKKIKDIFNQTRLGISDIYKLENLYQQKVVNECFFKQLYPLTFMEGDQFKFQSASIQNIAPFIKLEVDALARSTKYIAANIKNNSNYYFGNQDARDNIFDVTKESYYEVLSSYEEASKFLLELSKWYIKTIGGV